jgi:hypothetical protein
MREQLANHDIPKRSTATGYIAANQNRAGHSMGFHPEDQPYTPTPRKRPVEDEDDIPDSYYPQRMPSSVRRYDRQGNEFIQQGNKRLVIHREPPPQKVRPQKPRSHWLLFIGLGMVAMLGVWVGLQALGTWWTNHQLDSTYGFPRTYQTDERVGFGDTQVPTHFIALNLNGQTEVIVCPAANCAKAVVYLGPRLFGDTAASVPVTLSFQDTTHSGKLDMIVHVGDQQIIFFNVGTQFKLQQ